MLDPPKKVLFRPKQSTGLEDMRIDPQVNHPNVIGPWMLCGVGMDLFHARCRTGRESKPQKTCGRGEWEGSYMWMMASPKPFMGHLPKEPTIWPGLVTPCTTIDLYIHCMNPCPSLVHGSFLRKGLIAALRTIMSPAVSERNYIRIILFFPHLSGEGRSILCELPRCLVAPLVEAPGP